MKYLPFLSEFPKVETIKLPNDKSVLKRSKMSKPYYYIRFNWWKDVDLGKLENELAKKFHVERVRIPWDDRKISLFGDMNTELKIFADNLRAYVSPIRAILYQKKASPFTQRDLDLRNKLIEYYPRERPSPFPFMFGSEPEFEVMDEEQEMDI